jgi:hypothetical protein
LAARPPLTLAVDTNVMVLRDGKSVCRNTPTSATRKISRRCCAVCSRYVSTQIIKAIIAHVVKITARPNTRPSPNDGGGVGA